MYYSTYLKSQIYWNKGPCEAKSSAPPFLIKPEVEGFTKCKDLHWFLIFKICFTLYLAHIMEKNQIAEHFKKQNAHWMELGQQRADFFQMPWQ